MWPPSPSPSGDFPGYRRALLVHFDAARTHNLCFSCAAALVYLMLKNEAPRARLHTNLKQCACAFGFGDPKHSCMFAEVHMYCHVYAQLITRYATVTLFNTV